MNNQNSSFIDIYTTYLPVIHFSSNFVAFLSKYTFLLYMLEINYSPPHVWCAESDYRILFRECFPLNWVTIKMTSQIEAVSTHFG